VTKQKAARATSHPVDDVAPLEPEAAAADVETNAGAEEAAAEQELSLDEQLRRAQAQSAEYLDGWQRERAELANFRRRVERERSSWEMTLRTDFVLSILPALDDFDLVFRNQPEEAAQWADAVRMAHRKLMLQLEAIGVKEIEADGREFDPMFHQAVMQESSDEHESGMIIEVLRKGYLLGDQVLRASLVKVAQ